METLAFFCVDIGGSLAGGIMCVQDSLTEESPEKSSCCLRSVVTSSQVFDDLLAVVGLELSCKANGATFKTKSTLPAEKEDSFEEFQLFLQQFPEQGVVLVTKGFNTKKGVVFAHRSPLHFIYHHAWDIMMPP
jgi:hypothetical protein